ncbi:MAG: adenylate/guanylate cyclase domain-containing protein [Cyanothece sp. SIO2G6]|nr:adenylate/guanylate cyclase domain-containing protein [Cyanothece sp. SIO2G6]
MIGLRHLSIKSKIQLMLLVVSLVSIISISFLGWSWARAELKQNIFDHLTSVRASKSYQVESYFDTFKNHVETLCEDQMVVSAMREFNAAYNQLNQTAIPTDWDNAVRAYYTQEFFPRLTQHISGIPNYETYDPRGTAARYLQYHYIASNPNSVGEKDALADAGDGSHYSAVHRQYHILFQNLIKKFGYYDFFLIDPQTGNIVYSVYKETDYGTNLTDGPYSRSNFAKVVAAVQDNPDRGAIQVVDFKTYKPSYAAPAAFMACPIYDESAFVGILAVQMPVDEINQVLTGNQNWQRDGLGASGETYLVGPDYLMRSISRFLVEDKEGYKKALRSTGTPSQTVQLIDQLDTSILLQRVKTDAAKDAIAGKEGTRITNDYRGISVLSSYAPITLPGLEWAILSEMDLAEAYEPVYALQTYLLISTVILMLVLTFLAGIIAANFVKPIDTLIEASRKAELGQAEADIVFDSTDEFSELANIFNTVVQRMRQQINEVEQKFHETDRILRGFLPNEIAESLQRKDAAVLSQAQQVTTLFAKIVGLGPLSERQPNRIMSQYLTELLNSFNAAARRCDVEPFKFASDRYIATCGLVKPRLDHDKRMVDFALTLLDRIQEFNKTYGTRLSLRIGIHTGTVTTGILGTQQLSYDIWGQPVAIASSLVDTKDTNIIVTTQLVRNRLNGLYDFQKGPAIELESQTKLDTWVLQKGALADLIGELTSGLTDNLSVDESNSEINTEANTAVTPPINTPINTSVNTSINTNSRTRIDANTNIALPRQESFIGDIAGELGLNEFDS